MTREEQIAVLERRLVTQRIYADDALAEYESRMSHIAELEKQLKSLKDEKANDRPGHPA